MEKVIYVLWTSPDAPADTALRQGLADALRPVLPALGRPAVQVNLADAEVAPADGSRQTTPVGPIAGMVSVWLHTANPQTRLPLDDAVEAVPGVLRCAAYLVTESEPLRTAVEPAREQGRTPGYTQLAFLRRPAHLDQAAWLDRWLAHHTDVAIRTQSTVRYVQNVVARPLTAGAPWFDGIVEETFPAEAMTDPSVFFDAVDDPERLERHITEMVESCATFLDVADLDVVPTSEHHLDLS